MMIQPRYCFLLSILYLMVCVPAILFSIRVGLPNASVKKLTNAPRSQYTVTSGLVTIIILDMSGSMKQNDPHGLRCSAANAYIDLMSSTDRVGLIGLENNDGTREKSHGFLTAQTWTQPTLVGDPHILQETIAQKSQHCRPSGSTPTYDALNQAWTMLDGATKKENLLGSVILLTDGQPFPDCDDIQHNNCMQAQFIESELLPKFQMRKWPIDTIALGDEVDFRKLLNVLSNSTGGKFYDDTNGVVPGASPLNITPFFIDIFARHHHRVPGPTIAPITLNAESTSQPFVVDTHTESLDVIVVKEPTDNDVTKMPVILATPNPAVPLLPPEEPISGISYNISNPYYAFFSVSGPQKGLWHLNISGSGQFTLISLLVSNLRVSIASPTNSGNVLPLGQDFSIAATVNDKQMPVSDTSLSMMATIEYNGMVATETARPLQTVILFEQGNTGFYQGKATEPLNAPSGSYTITISASEVSSAIIAGDTSTIVMAALPRPVISPLRFAVLKQDPILQFLNPYLEVVYNIPIEPVPLFNQWLSRNTLLQPTMRISGTIELNGKSYVDAQVTSVTLTHNATKSTVNLKQENTKNGRFSFVLPSQDDGSYTVELTIEGTVYDNLHHALGRFTMSSMDTIMFTHTPATLSQEIIPWAIVLVILVLIVVSIIYCIRFTTTPFPFGQWEMSKDGMMIQDAKGNIRRNFRKTHHILQQLFFRRNILLSVKIDDMPPGLQFRFRRGPGARRKIEVRLWGRGSDCWTQESGEPIPTNFREIFKLVYHPGTLMNTKKTRVFKPIVYTIIPR